MRNKRIVAALAAGAGAGYLAGKKRHENRNSYRKMLSRLEDYINDMR